MSKFLAILTLCMTCFGYSVKNNHENQIDFEPSIDHEENSENEFILNNDPEGIFVASTVFDFTASNVKDVSVEGDNELNDYTINDDRITISFLDLVHDSSNGITFSFNNGETKIIEVFFYITFENAYYSFLSRGSLLRYAGVITDSSLDNDKLVAQSQYTGSSTNTSSGLNIPNSHAIYGYMKWSNTSGLVFPLYGMKVKLVTPEHSYETYTNSDGYYKLIVFEDEEKSNDLSSISLHLYAKSETTSVIYNENTIYEKCWNNINLSSTKSYELNYTFVYSNDNDMSKAIQIAQAAKYYSDYIKTLNDDEAITECTFNYPTAQSNCNYNSKDKMVRITNANSKKGLYSFESWDIIGHEYGHHIQHVFGITKSPGGNHTSSGNDVDATIKKANIKTKQSQNPTDCY